MVMVMVMAKREGERGKREGRGGRREESGEQKGTCKSFNAWLTRSRGM
jgi:hypothetical protein